MMGEESCLREKMIHLWIMIGQCNEKKSNWAIIDWLNGYYCVFIKKIPIICWQRWIEIVSKQWWIWHNCNNVNRNISKNIYNVVSLHSWQVIDAAGHQSNGEGSGHRWIHASQLKRDTNLLMGCIQILKRITVQNKSLVKMKEMKRLYWRHWRLFNLLHFVQDSVFDVVPAQQQQPRYEFYITLHYITFSNI